MDVTKFKDALQRAHEALDDATMETRNPGVIELLDNYMRQLRGLMRDPEWGH